jgi:hypothetical protein
MSKLEEKPSALSTSKNVLTFFCVCEWFLSSWIRIRNPNPDTDPGTPIESGSNTDPVPDLDPQHCSKGAQ